MDEKKQFSSFNKDNFHICSSNQFNEDLSTIDIRSVILNDDIAIEYLQKLYRFYELHSELVS